MSTATTEHTVTIPPDDDGMTHPHDHYPKDDEYPRNTSRPSVSSPPVPRKASMSMNKIVPMETSYEQRPTTAQILENRPNHKKYPPLPVTPEPWSLLFTLQMCIHILLLISTLIFAIHGTPEDSRKSTEVVAWIACSIGHVLLLLATLWSWYQHKSTTSIIVLQSHLLALLCFSLSLLLRTLDTDAYTWNDHIMQSAIIIGWIGILWLALLEMVLIHFQHQMYVAVKRIGQRLLPDRAQLKDEITSLQSHLQLTRQSVASLTHTNTTLIDREHVMKRDIADLRHTLSEKDDIIEKERSHRVYVEHKLSKIENETEEKIQIAVRAAVEAHSFIHPEAPSPSKTTTSTSSTELSSIIQQQQDKITTLQEQINSLSNQLAASAKTVSIYRRELEESRTQAQSEITRVKQEMIELEQQVGQITGDADERHRLIEEAATKFANLKPRVGCDFVDGPSYKKGVVLTQVIDGSPAALGGLLLGDIVLSVNGVETSTKSAFKQELVKCHPGDQVAVVIDRGGDVLTRVLEIGSPNLTRQQILDIRRIAFGIVRQSDYEKKPWA